MERKKHKNAHLLTDALEKITHLFVLCLQHTH